MYETLCTRCQKGDSSSVTQTQINRPNLVEESYSCPRKSSTCYSPHPKSVRCSFSRFLPSLLQQNKDRSRFLRIKNSWEQRSMQRSVRTCWSKNARYSIQTWKPKENQKHANRQCDGCPVWHFGNGFVGPTVKNSGVKKKNQFIVINAQDFTNCRTNDFQILGTEKAYFLEEKNFYGGYRKTT